MTNIDKAYNGKMTEATQYGQIIGNTVVVRKCQGKKVEKRVNKTCAKVTGPKNYLVIPIRK